MAFVSLFLYSKKVENDRKQLVDVRIFTILINNIKTNIFTGLTGLCLPGFRVRVPLGAEKPPQNHEN